MRLVEILVVVLCLLLMLGPKSDASEGKIWGKVTDQKTGQPLEGVSVTIKGTSLVTKSNSSGKYLIENIPAGTHNVDFVIKGYIKIDMEVEIKTGQTIERDVQIESIAEQIRELKTVHGKIPEDPFRHHPPSGTITGRVMNKRDGNGIRGANVKFKGETWGATTDSAGKYGIGVMRGIYTLEVTAKGYDSVEVTNIEVKAKNTVVKNIELTPSGDKLGKK
jgi:hypothetical protein